MALLVHSLCLLVTRLSSSICCGTTPAVTHRQVCSVNIVDINASRTCTLCFVQINDMPTLWISF